MLMSDGGGRIVGIERARVPSIAVNGDVGANVRIQVSDLTSFSVSVLRSSALLPRADASDFRVTPRRNYEYPRRGEVSPFLDEIHPSFIGGARRTDCVSSQFTFVQDPPVEYLSVAFLVCSIPQISAESRRAFTPT